MTNQLQNWDEEIKKLPDGLRLHLANYAAQQFLDGVAKGEKQTKNNKQVIEDIYKMVVAEQKRYAHGGDMGADMSVFFAIQSLVTQIDRKYRNSKDWPACHHGEAQQ